LSGTIITKLGGNLTIAAGVTITNKGTIDDGGGSLTFNAGTSSFSMIQVHR